MKNLTSLLMVALTVLLFTSCQDKPKEHKGTVDIKAQTGAVKTDVASHKPFDVEVYRLTYDTMSVYNFVYYQTESDSLKNHGGMYGTSSLYTKADYNWVNDTVSITLTGADSVKPKSFRLYGKGSSNGMLNGK